MKRILTPFDWIVIVVALAVIVVVAGFAVERSAHGAACDNLGVLLGCGEGR